MSVIGKDNQLIFLSLVPDSVHRFLHVANINSLSDSVYADDCVWYVLVLALSKQLLFTHVVQSEHATDANEDTALISTDRQWNFIDRSAMNELEIQTVWANSEK